MAEVVLRCKSGGLIQAAISAISAIMASITVRNFDDELKVLLQTKARQNGHSMEEEARVILAKALKPERNRKGLGTAINEMFKDIGGADDLPTRPREKLRPPLDFGEW